jgi:aminoglycoside/choline kinase family phosphotransferase
VDLSSEREAEKAAFLAAAGLASARREPLTGDASTRAYERLHLADRTLIFMDQPPSVETAPCPPGATPAERQALGYNALARLAAGRVDAFIATAGWLREQGLSAPAIVHADAARGLAVIEDLGDDLYARRDVSREIEARALARYFALRPDMDRDTFLADYHALGALNVARILGIFARLVTRDAKPRYAAFMPRLWDYLDRCLADPQLGGLKAWFDRHVPAGSRT